MQTNYYLLNGKDKSGPFSFDQLKEQEITDKFMIWKEGMEEWKLVTELTELGSIIKKSPSVPPPTPSELKQKHKEVAINIALRRAMPWMIGIAVLTFVLAGGLASDSYLEETYIQRGDVYTEVSTIRWLLIPTISVLMFSLPITIIVAFFKYQLVLKREDKLMEYANSSVNEVVGVLFMVLVLGIFIAFVILNGDYMALAGNILPFIPWSALPISILLYKWFYLSYSRYGKSPLSWLLISPKG